MLARIQNELFDLGADLCRPGDDVDDPKRCAITDGQVERLEREIDAMNAELAPLTSFVLPGGTPAAAYLHLARTVVAPGRAAGRASWPRRSRSIPRPSAISTAYRTICSSSRAGSTTAVPRTCSGFRAPHR